MEDPEGAAVGGVLKKTEHALIGTLIANLLAGVIAATLLWAQVHEHDRRLDRLESADQAAVQKTAEMAMAVVELRGVIAALKETVGDLRSTVRSGGGLQK
jgi:hypothetical protein